VTAISWRPPARRKAPGTHRRPPEDSTGPLSRRVLRGLAGKSARYSLPLTGTIALTGGQEGYRPVLALGLAMTIGATALGWWPW
jgi:hypothetical protein